MRKIGKITAGLAAAAMTFGFAACGETSDKAAEETSEFTTTTAATVEKNTETLNEEAQSAIDNTSDKLRDEELEIKTVNWLSHYDPFNPSSTGNSKSVTLSYFETKYGGKVKWYPTTWDERYNDLATYVLGGEGIDFFDCDTNALPNGIISGMFQPVDDYIDLSDELWSSVANGMDIYSFCGKHYEFVTGITAENMLFYSHNTMEENGLEDPAELWEKGEWNWDKFKEMLTSYVGSGDEHYGLDGWYNEKALLLSAGVPIVGKNSEGRLVSNLDNETVGRAMDFQYSLYKDGLALDLSTYNWTTQLTNMGEGKELFYIAGAWEFESDPSVWSTGMIPSDVRIVPVPAPKDSKLYVGSTISGWCLCKGAANPSGVARLAECALLAGMDEEAQNIADQKHRDDFGWTDSMIESCKKINDLAKAEPVVDLSTGVIINDDGAAVGLRAAFRGTEWSVTREERSEYLTELLNDVNRQLTAV